MSAPRETVQTARALFALREASLLRRSFPTRPPQPRPVGRGIEGKADSRSARESTGTGGGDRSDSGWRGKGRDLRHLLNWDKVQDTQTHELMGALD